MTTIPTWNAIQPPTRKKSDLIRAGGFKIYTSLDSSLQDMLQADIDQGLSLLHRAAGQWKHALQGAGVIVDNRSNYVVAIVGGRGSGDQFNRAYLSARQPGSTIKPLIDYGPAFDTGEYYPTRMVNDHKWEDGPSNSGGNYHGSVTVREALNRSPEHKWHGRYWRTSAWTTASAIWERWSSKSLHTLTTACPPEHRRLYQRRPCGGHG